MQGGEKIAHPLDEELSKQVGYKVYLVHRLDRDTSGLIVVAKSSAAASKWISLIAGKQVQKEYEAVCFGRPKDGGNGIITDSVVKAGVEKSAVTHYRVIKTFEVSKPQNDENSSESSDSEKITLSHLHLKLGTGRMHQIRIHLAKIGCPIACDDQHGNFKMNKILRKAVGAKVLMLASVRLTLPIDGKPRTFEIELPPHMQNVLKSDTL